jgi:hypothetical protein
MLGVVGRPRMHGMHMRLLISIPIGLVLLRILGHHGRHLLLVVRRVLVMRPHGRRHVGICAILPPLRHHGHGRLPVRKVILLHGCDGGAFRGISARTWCRGVVQGASPSFLIFGFLDRGLYLIHVQRIDGRRVR